MVRPLGFRRPKANRLSANITQMATRVRDRTLTKSPITPADQAEAFFLLLSGRLSKTTGQVITVDGGLHEAFLR
ncbi:MAG TPA: SDR family oxidoreductase [Gemmataceae bacterium]|nr:SDR family oxidoreductase [Gemmataceae bacterium]